MSGKAVADPLARTVLAWQRTLLVLAGLVVVVAVALSAPVTPHSACWSWRWRCCPCPVWWPVSGRYCAAAPHPSGPRGSAPVALAALCVAAAALIAVAA